MGIAQAEGQATKGCDRELRGADGGRRRGGWAGGKSERRPGNIAVVLPLPWLFGQGIGNFPLKYNTLHMLYVASQ